MTVDPKPIAILTVIILASGVASQCLPLSFAYVTANPATKPGDTTKPKQVQGEQGPAPVGGNGFGTTGIQRQKIQSGGGEQGPSGTTTDPTGFGANNVKQQQIQKNNQGGQGQGQKCLGPIISVSTPSSTDNYIWIDNVGPWRNWVSNWHVSAGNHHITIDRYSYETGQLIQHVVRLGYTDNCHPFTFRWS